MRKLSIARFKNEAFLAIVYNFSGMFCSLMTGVGTARLLSPDDRGLLALAVTISSLSYLISSLGTNNAVRTFQPTRSWASFRIYLRLSTLLLLLNAVIVVFVVSFFIMTGFIGLSENVFIITILGMSTFFSNQMLDMFNAVGRISHSAFANTVGHFTTAILIGVLFLIDIPVNLLVMVLAAYVAGFTGRVLIMTLLMRRERIDLGPQTADKGLYLLRSGVKFWGIGLGQTLTFRSDQLLLGYLTNAYTVGIYAVAIAPATLMQVVSNSIGQIAYRDAATGRITLRRYSNFILISFGITFLYGLFIWILAPWLIPLIFGPDYSDSVEIVRVLLIGELFLSPYLISVRMLAGANHPHFASISGIMGFLILLPSHVLLVPIYGGVGAAWGNVIAYSVMLAIVLIGVVVHFRQLQKPASVSR